MRTHIIAILAAGSALAAFQPATAAPQPTWSGLYVGGTVGANFANSRFSLPGDTGDVLQSDHDSRTSFTGGGLVGFNYQMGNYVVGLEGDVVGGSNTRQVTACNAFDGCWTPSHDSFTTFNRLRQGTTGHIRVRLGYATGPTLIYAAGGYSLASTRMDLIGDCYNFGDPASPTVYNFSRNKTVSGFNVGAGVEQAVTRHLSVRAEYLFDDFGTQTYTGNDEWNDRQIHLDNSTLRVAASYRF